MTSVCPSQLRALRFGLGMFLAACSSASAPPEAISMRIVTTSAQYTPGGQVTLRFTSLSSDVLYYNNCNGFLDRRLGTGWAPVNRAAGSRVCPDDQKILQAGASDTTVHLLPEMLLPGVYRYRFTGIYGPDQNVLPEVERVSSRFSVVR